MISLLLTVGIMLPSIVGCEEDAQLGDVQLHHTEVKAVIDQGVTLDEKADPTEVVFVLLRAIHDDVTAASLSDRQAAIDREFAVAAPDHIYSCYRQAYENDGRQPTYQRDEWVHKTVMRWAPTLAYYVDSFNPKMGFDLAIAKKRMVVSPAGRGQSNKAASGDNVAVRMVLEPPDDQPNANVVMLVRLHRSITASGARFWRVYHVGFDPGRRSLPPKITRMPAPSPTSSPKD